MDIHIKKLIVFAWLFWQQRKTDMAFPPYWFYFSAEGNFILDRLLNAERSVGVHVPVKVPERLVNTGKDIFIKPGETRVVNPF